MNKRVCRQGPNLLRLRYRAIFVSAVPAKLSEASATSHSRWNCHVFFGWPPCRPSPIRNLRQTILTCTKRPSAPSYLVPAFLSARAFGLNTGTSKCRAITGATQSICLPNIDVSEGCHRQQCAEGQNSKPDIHRDTPLRCFRYAVYERCFELDQGDGCDNFVRLR